MQKSTVKVQPFRVSPARCTHAVANEIDLGSWYRKTIAHFMQVLRILRLAAALSPTWQARLIIWHSAARITLDKFRIGTCFYLQSSILQHWSETVAVTVARCLRSTRNF